MRSFTISALAAVVSFAASLTACSTGNVQPADPTQVAFNVSRGVCGTVALEQVTLVAGQLHSSQGQGFVLEDGTIVTANHFPKTGPGVQTLDFTAIDCEDRRVNVEFVNNYDGYDIAMLKTIGNERLAEGTLKVADSPAKIGDQVYAYRGFDKIAHGYVIERPNSSPMPSYMLTTNLMLQHGDSGGPLFNQDHEVVGFTSTGVIGGNTVVYAVPVAYLKAGLAGNAIDNDSLVSGIEDEACRRERASGHPTRFCQ